MSQDLDNFEDLLQPEAQPAPQAHLDNPRDPASESLADALRVSFRLLTIIMILVAVAFILSGVSCIEPQQVGIKKVFGKITGIARPGLAYTWPFPIGEIEIVSVKEHTLEIDDFWMHETAEDKTRDLLSRRISGPGLRPGWDGAMFTGDRNLLHAKIACSYAIRDPVAYKKHISDLDETIRSVVCRAAINAAAKRTADGIQRTEKARFAADIKADAQQQLNEILNTTKVGIEGIKITKINVPAVTWPLRALPAYNLAQGAILVGESLQSEALEGGEKTVNQAAGAGWKALVGESWQKLTGENRKELVSQEDQDVEDDGYGLIGQYGQAKRDGDLAAAKEILAKIDAVLLQNTTGGQASAIISEAAAYRTQIIQRVKARANRFNELLTKYQESPQFMLERLWADVRDEILSAPTVEKFYLTFDESKTILRINRDPEVVREIQRAQLKARKSNE